MPKKSKKSVPTTVRVPLCPVKGSVVKKSTFIDEWGQRIPCLTPVESPSWKKWWRDHPVRPGVLPLEPTVLDASIGLVGYRVPPEDESVENA